ncbi:MAG: hypothetical protein KC613_15015, partial [Myxococcales bacterium]|nr:hypothetical protein [Myxococcales bacterium]
ELRASIRRANDLDRKVADVMARRGHPEAAEALRAATPKRRAWPVLPDPVAMPRGARRRRPRGQGSERRKEGEPRRVDRLRRRGRLLLRVAPGKHRRIAGRLRSAGLRLVHRSARCLVGGKVAGKGPAKQVIRLLIRPALEADSEPDAALR